MPETESYQFDVLDPEELSKLVAVVKNGASTIEPASAGPSILEELDGLVSKWCSTFSRYDQDAAGEPEYRALIQKFRRALRPYRRRLPPDAAYSVSVIATVFARTNRRSATRDTAPHAARYVRTRRVTVDVATGMEELVVRLNGTAIRLPLPLAETLFAFRTPATRRVAMTRLRGRISCSESMLDESLERLLALRFVRVGAARAGQSSPEV